MPKNRAKSIILHTENTDIKKLCKTFKDYFREATKENAQNFAVTVVAENDRCREQNCL